MADIPLRTYVEQLDNLIERKQVDEVIAHCRHILGLYPKHLDTYRMLGKALLEKGRHGDAADIFQRVLSVMPDDFISHVGMSIVREDEANIDAAIWHMERSFESAPSNGAIQQELCRLYGRRDGVVPAKARLTRGALARMYAQGGLYLQAEAELKAALAAEADRFDLLTKLADVYWQTDQPAQAAQTSAAILQKLPYSLEANRILVSVFRAQGRPADAAVYRQRLEALDPYEAFADPGANGAGAARVDPAKITVARLEYVPGMEDSGSPDWLASIGAKFEEPASARAPEAQPDWLSAAGETGAAAPAGDYQPDQGNVPDWLKDLGLGTAPLPATPGSVANGLPDWLMSATGPLPPESVPGWMLQGAADGEQVTAELQTPPIDAADVAGRPAQATPVQDKTNDATLATQAASASIEPAGEVPDWLKTTAPDDTEEELPDWLKAITAQPMPEASVEASTSHKLSIPAAEKIPDWLQAAAPDDASLVPNPSAASRAVPDWLQAAASTPPGTGPLPDWLKIATGELDLSKVPPPPAAVAPATIETAAIAEPPSPPETPASVEPATAAATTTQEQPVAVPEPAILDSLPDWLKTPAVAGETPAAPAPPVEPAPTLAAAAAPEPATEMPDWLKAAAPAEASMPTATDLVRAASAAPVPPVEEPVVAPLAEAELPDWLQAATAAPIQDETPVWLQTAPAGPSLVAAQADEEPELTIPDWLRAVAAGAPPADAGSSAAHFEAAADTSGTAAAAAANTPTGAPLSPAPVELPEYLQMASPEAIARAEQPLEMETQDEEPEEAEPTVALPAEIPDWLKTLAPISPDPVVPASPSQGPVEAEVPAFAGLDDSLSWMDELTAPAAPANETQVTEAKQAEPPALLAAPEAAGAIPGGLGQDTLAAEIPPWAQNEEPGPTDTIASWLAGKHGPGWLRQPANEAPSLPAVEWEPDSAPASTEPPEVDSLSATTAQPEPALTSAPDPDSLDADAAFRWLESLAARQGANPAELFTSPMEADAALPGATAPEQVPTVEATAEPSEPAAKLMALTAETTPTASQLTASMEAVAATAPPAAEPGGLEEFLRQAEAAMPVAHLADTAPNKLKPPTAEAPEAAAVESMASMTPVPETTPVEAPSPAGEPAPTVAMAAETANLATPASPALAEPASSSPEFDADAAMRWLEGLAAQQGAKPEELLTAPEDRTLAAPRWVAAEQTEAMQTEQPAAEQLAPAAESAATEAEPEITPTADNVVVAATAEVTGTEALAAPVEAAAVPIEPTVVVAAEARAPDADAEAAMHWLEGLTAQQGANPEELLTTPEERTLEAPAWVSAQAAEATAEPAAQAMTPAEPETSVEAEPEPEPAAEYETPEWLKALAPVEEQAGAALAAETPAAEPAAPAPAEPQFAPAGADLDKLSRLAERLGAARRAREAEMEARFAEQRTQQEAARRWVEERLEAAHAKPQAAAETAAQAEPVADQVATSSVAAEPAAAAQAAPVPSAASRRHPRPSIRARRARSEVQATSPVIAPADALARGQAALSGRDYEAAVAHLSVLVEHGQNLDTVVQTLESATDVGRAPVPVLRLLGDAYMRTDQLQKALDTYRQALSRL